MIIRQLSAALQKKAEEELSETPSKMRVDLKSLRDWFGTQPYLNSVKPTDQWLVAFLRGCKYNMEKTKGKIEMHYKLKRTLPEFFGNRDPLDPGIQELLKMGVLLPLKKCMSDDSPRIILVRPGLISHTKRSLADLIKVSLMIIEILCLEDDNFTIAGEDVLVDGKDIALSLLWQWTPSMAKNLMSCSEKALSVRLKSMHMIHAPFYIGTGIRIFRMFAGTKLRNRMYSHDQDLETLYDHFDKFILPEEYGGTDGTVEELIEYWKAKVESYRDWFVEQNACTDEAKSSNNSDIISTEVRSFQSLEVD